jgi:hypothetical protein
MLLFRCRMVSFSSTDKSYFASNDVASNARRAVLGGVVRDAGTVRQVGGRGLHASALTAQRKLVW